MSGVAVVTTAHGRHEHLRRQRVSLAAGTVVPDLHVVVAMDDPAVAGVAVGDGPPVEVLAVGRDPLGLPLAAFISIRPIDPSQPDDCAARLEHIPEIESCWSVAGEESYVLKVRSTTPAALEDLLARIRSAANVSTRTTIVLTTYYENRPVTGE